MASADLSHCYCNYYKMRSIANSCTILNSISQALVAEFMRLLFAWLPTSSAKQVEMIITRSNSLFLYCFVVVHSCQVAEPLLPYALSFAAGAMVFVVVDDIIPEAQSW